MTVADESISQLTDVGVPMAADEFVVVDTSAQETKRVLTPYVMNIRDVDSYNGLAAAIGIWNADGSDVTLLVRTSQATLSSNLTVNSNISLILHKGCLIPLDSAILTINGPFDAGLYQVFSWTGTGKVVFGAGSVKEVYPEWWGAVGDGGTSECYAAFVAAITTGRNVHIAETDSHYKVSGEITVSTAGQAIYGDGDLSHIKQYTNLTNIFRLTADHIKIYDLKMEGTSTGDKSDLPASYGSAVVIHTSDYCTVKNNHILNCSAPGQATGAGVWITGGKYNLVKENRIISCHHGINTDAWVGGSISKQNRIIDNHIEECYTGYISDLQGSEKANHIGDLVQGNVIRRCTSRNIEISWTNHSIVSNNILSGVKGDATYDAIGIVIGWTTFNAVISGNQITDIGGEAGIVVTNVDGNVPRKITIIGNSINYGDGHGLKLYTCRRITIMGNEISHNDLGGIYSASGFFPHSIIINGNIVCRNQKHGIHFNYIQAVSISNNEIMNNSQEGSGTYDGIFIDSDVDGGSIHGNIFSSSIDTEIQRYALNIETSWVKNLLFTNNQSHGQVTGGVKDDTGNLFQAFNTHGKYGEQHSVNKLRVEGRRHDYGTAAPTTGTYTHGAVRWKSDAAAGGSPGWVCTESGTFGAATDNTGDTDGATAVITGMTDTSDFAEGSYVDVSAGFPATGPYKILSKTATTITIDEDSDAAQLHITVNTSDPIFKAMANLAS